MIRRSFSYSSKDIALHLYKVLVRPHLEYCVQAWRPYFKKTELMDGIQMRVTKLVPSMRKYSYEERLKFFNLTICEMRRIRGDLIEVLKILKGYEDAQTFFELSKSCTRGHSSELFKAGCNLDCRKYTFAHRIVDICNSLDEDTIACDSLNGLKSRIDRIFQSREFI
jgi:ribonucleases P/MRP protein subunit RPP40